MDEANTNALKELLILFGVLDRLPVTSYLACSTKLKIARHCFVKRHLPAGCLLLHRGMDLRSMFVLTHGIVDVLTVSVNESSTHRVLSTQRCKKIAEFKDECVLGVDSLSLASLVSPVTVRARTDCELYELARCDFQRAAAQQSNSMENKLRALLQLAQLPPAWQLVRSSLNSELTQVGKYNAAAAICRRVVVQKEVITRLETGGAPMVLIERGLVQVRNYRLDKAGRVTETKVNLADGDVFGVKNFSLYLVCAARQQGRHFSGHQVKDLVLPGCVIQAKALETSEILVLDPELFIRYSRHDPCSILRSLLAGDVFALGHKYLQL